MNKICLSLLLILIFTGVTMAQECGPNCPVCSGAGSTNGALLDQGSILISGLTIPDADEERVVFNTRYGLLNWLDAGLGYAVRTETVLWNVRVQPQLEQENSWQPGIILGTGSVETGGSDQSIYFQFFKSLEISDKVSVGFSTGLATLVPDFDKYYGQAGVAVSFSNRWTAFANYDGKATHEGLSWTASDKLSLSFLMVESEYPAISVVYKK